MTYRKLIFANTQFYHIYNRTIADEEIFSNKRDIDRMINLMDYYRFDNRLSLSHFLKLPDKERKDYLHKRELPIVEIHAFCFMPNHYHFLVRQMNEGGVSKFVSLVQNAMAKYINKRRKRNGSLFCNMFKAKHIDDEETFMHVSRYIHLNPVTGFLLSFEDLQKSKLTSLIHYLDRKTYPFLSTYFLLNENESNGLRKYITFLENQKDYQRKLHSITRLLID